MNVSRIEVLLTCTCGHLFSSTTPFSFFNPSSSDRLFSVMLRRYVSTAQGPELIHRKAKMTGKSVDDLKTRKVPIPGFKGEPVYGIHSVLGALIAKRRICYKLYMKDSVKAKSVTDERISRILEYSAGNGIQVNRLTQAQMDRIANFQLHNGVILDSSPIKSSKLGNFELSVFMDGVMDPGNIGSIARNCLFFGADQMILERGRGPSSITPSMSKSSSGALEYISVASSCNLAELIAWRRSNSVQFICTSDESSAARYRKNTIPLRKLKIDISRPICLIIGAEENGIRPELVGNCDHLVCIKGVSSHTNVTSLNVSVVAGIVLQKIRSTKEDMITMTESESSV